MSATADKSAKTDKTANSQKPSERELSNQKFNAGLSGAFGCLVFIIFIFSIESVISFTNNDVQDVCPHSQLWWATLFMGIVFPLLLIVSAIMQQKARKILSFCVMFSFGFVHLLSLLFGAWISCGEFPDLLTIRVCTKTLEPRTPLVKTTTKEDIICSSQ